MFPLNQKIAALCMLLSVSAVLTISSAAEPEDTGGKTDDYIGAVNKRVATLREGVETPEPGELDSFIAALTVIVKLKGQGGRASSTRAEVYSLKGEANLAIADCTSVLEKDGYDPFLRELRADNYASLKNYREAISDYTISLEQFSKLKHSTAQILHSRAKAYCGNKEYGRALNDYFKLLDLPPDDRDVDRNKKEVDEDINECIGMIRASGVKPALVSIRLDVQISPRAVKRSPPFRIADDSEKTFEETYHVQHSVGALDWFELAPEPKTQLSALLLEMNDAFLATMAKATGQNYDAKTIRKRSVTIKGSKSEKETLLIWVEYFRTGVAQVSICGDTVNIPFEFRDDFDLMAANPPPAPVPPAPMP